MQGRGNYKIVGTHTKVQLSTHTQQIVDTDMPRARTEQCEVLLESHTADCLHAHTKLHRLSCQVPQFTDQHALQKFVPHKGLTVVLQATLATCSSDITNLTHTL